MSSQSQVSERAETPADESARRHGLRAGRRVSHGFGRALSRGSASAPGQRRRILDRQRAGDEPPVPQVRQCDEACDVRRDYAEGGGLSGRAAAHAEGGLARLFASERAGRSQGLVAMVAVQIRRRLAKTVRAALFDQRNGRSSRRACRLSRRRGLRALGRQGIADRGRVGVCGARRP